MEEDDIVEGTGAGADSVGSRLRVAREKAGLEIAQVAAETRIPQRHLQSIEEGKFSTLPSRTYAIGFSRTFARAVGLDEHEIMAQVREELAAGASDDRGVAARFEPGDPARVPDRGLAWFALLATLLLLAGVYAFYQSYFAPGIDPAPLREESVPVAAASPATISPVLEAVQPTVSDPVVFTNEVDGTWVRFYDGEGERLFEGIMARGDTFTIPADAVNPQIRTGRPYAFAITVGGKSVPRLSEKDETVSDVPVTATALLARPPASTAASSQVSSPSAPASPPT
ncbi:helix-turn-helix domain-containing protein [Erythrobacter mangrovi]|uniref:Helix-turn-helix domain-containing protein n=1 Tax=Erythrobacter mangrovi TaxID=2739433 RepID=A0A7D4CDX8_9SPHN|nr:helix-turn-helix domain-containing protein [Erythrobacter mangrovi]QKG72049.1 helix-turn-helix domain-containing protein [Erythrobacter mangrovi]